MWHFKHFNSLQCRIYCVDISILHSNRQWSIVTIFKLQYLQRGEEGIEPLGLGNWYEKALVKLYFHQKVSKMHNPAYKKILIIPYCFFVIITEVHLFFNFQKSPFNKTKMHKVGSVLKPREMLRLGNMNEYWHKNNVQSSESSYIQ